MSTEVFMAAYLAAPPDRREAALKALQGRDQAANVDPLDRVISRREAAEILGCSTKTVTRYAKAGIIRQLRFGGKGCRASGYSAQSVQKAISRGKAVQ